jgi:hypothetical protein
MTSPPSARRPRRILRRPTTVLAATLAIACGDDGGSGNDDTTGSASGFTGGVTMGDDDGDGSTAAPVDSTADDTASDDDAPWGGTAYDGELLAIVTFVYSAPNAVRDEPLVGIAGGYRTVELGFSGIEDLWSPLAYSLPFPPLPDDADTLSADGPLGTFDWGEPEDWLKAGNGMKLRLGEDGPAATACLVAYFPTVELPDGYPLYRSTETGDPACAPDPEAFQPGASYDVVLYGGGVFEDNVLLERVTTPAALEVSAPDLDTYDLPVDSDAPLSFQWTAGDDPDARIEIRLVDTDGNLLSVHAADDGEYSIPAAELSALSPGPLDVLVARERTDRVQFTDGGVTVTSRYERWGFFDLLPP